MRILHVIPFFTPQMGGSAHVCFQMARHLGDRGHAVTVVTSDYRVRESAFPAGPFEVVFLPNLVAGLGFYFSPALIQWARRNASRFDVIHLHTFRTFQNAVLRHYAVRSQVPLLLSAHGTLPVIVERKLPKKVFDLLAGKAILNSASRLVAVSNMEAKQYRQVGIKPERIRVIFNGLDLDEFNHLPERGSFRSKINGLDHKTKIILFLGRINKIKGIDQLILAFSKLEERIDPILLLIAGPDDGELNKLQGMVDKLGLQKKVHFVGPLYGENKLAAYVDADILVSLAHYEIFGLVPFEALLCSTPVIVGEDCGTGELFAETGAGYLVRYGNVEQLTNTLMHVLSSPEETQKTVQLGKDFIHQQLAWPSICTKLENLYQEMVH